MFEGCIRFNNSGNIRLGMLGIPGGVKAERKSRKSRKRSLSNLFDSLGIVCKAILYPFPVGIAWCSMRSNFSAR